MATATAYRVVFPEWYDERGEWEAKEKGWLQGVQIHFADGRVESLFFYDPVRLAQDLESYSEQGRPYVAERGLIVIPEITRQAVLSTVENLVGEDYFATPDQAVQPWQV